MPAVNDSTPEGGWPELRAERLFEKVAGHLEADIMQGRLAAGEKLPNETELSRRFRVGRSAVREALKTLELRGLLEVRRGFNGGTFVRPPDQIQASYEVHVPRPATAEEQDLVLVRTALEPLAARLAAARAGPALAEQLEALVRREQEAAPYPALFIEAALAFHQEIAEASGSGLLRTLVEALGTLIQHRLNGIVQAGGEQDVVRAHTEICRAIGAGDGDRAAELMADHLRAQPARDRGAPAARDLA